MIELEKPIIFFDGVCGLCNKFVDFVLSNDTKNSFLFSPLQGETFRQLTQYLPNNFPDSVVLYENGKFYFKSKAALEILKGLGGTYQFFVIGYLVPNFLRNIIYDWVASNRYKWFGKRESCRLPTPEEKAKFLP